jgi:3-oxoacyl-[acyl-carrier protein] reductase
MNDTRRVLVTGGSGGIGRAITAAFSAAGAVVAATSRSGRIPDAPLALAMDLEDPGSIVAAVTEATDGLGGIDTLVANAVRWPTGFAERFEDLDPRDWRAVLRANIEGTFSLIQAALPVLRTSGAGRIVIISSGAAEEGHPPAAHYIAAKAALHGLCRALAWDAGRDGILVNVIAAGFTRTRTRI